MHHDAPHSLTADEIIHKAIITGWKFDKTLLYDEEGIPGHVWYGPNGDELFSIDGEDDKLVPPDEFWEMFDLVTQQWQEDRKKKIDDFATFLRGLMKR